MLPQRENCVITITGSGKQQAKAYPYENKIRPKSLLIAFITNVYAYPASFKITERIQTNFNIAGNLLLS